MAQHDYNIANQSGADFRADLNNALLAIATVNSGATEPSTTFAHQLWVDTSSSVLKIRNAADNAWITTGVSITASNTFTGDLTGNVTGNLTGNVTGNVTGDLTGNADSADILTTARTISLSGDVVGSVSFDGSTNVDIDTVVQINSITLGTDTTGDYVESMSGGTGVTVTGGTGEGSTPSIAIGQSVASTDDVTFNTVTATDEFIGDIDGSVRFTAKADEALSKGDIIYVSGVSGNTPTIGKAKADDASKMPAFGIAAEDANANTNLQIVTLGNLINVDTSNESVGEILYVSTTAGEYSTTAPTGESSQIQNIGKVLRSHAVNGSIKVGGAGRSNATPNLDNGKIFIGNGSNQSTTATLDTSIVVENTNLYYTTARANTDFDSRLATKDTGDLTEGSNLYYTTARVNTDFDTRLGTKSTSDLAEGTNLYYTSARFDSAFTSKDTDDLSEGTTNLYYTTTRFDSAFGNKTTADLTENTNLYYTDTRANSAIDARVTKAFVDALGIQANTVAANSVALGTDTTGNYIQTITGTANKITVSGSGSESADVTLSLPDDVQIADSLTVAGNLTVNGTLTSLDTTNLDIEDNLFQLNAGLTGSPVNDSGMLINRGTSDNSIFMWDESVDKFTMGLTTADGSATGNITLNSLGTLVVNVEGNLTGNVTGTVSSLSNHDTDDLAEGSNLYYTQARFDSAFTAKSTSDLSEGTNLYYTDARFDTRLASKDTDDVSEGTSNLYYTSTRFDSAFSGKSTSDLSEGTNLYYTSARANTDFDTRLATKDTGDLSEGSNLYYTDARVQAVSINNVVEDTTPQLGGNLDLNSSDITGTGDINIAGTATMDGLTVDGYIQFTDSGSSNRNILYLDGSDNVVLATGTTAGARGIDLYTNNNKSLSVAENGDISFYEDTGSTAKFFWDASAESLSITGNANVWTIDNTTIYGNRAGGSIYVGNSSATGEFGITSGGSVAMQFDTDGNVGIATSPSQKLSVSDGMHVTEASATAANADGTYTVAIGANSGAKSLLTAGSIASASNTDTQSVFGRTAIGFVSGLSDFAFVGHVDAATSSNYGFVQSSSGATYLNGASGQSVNLQIGGSRKVVLDSSGNLLVSKTASSFNAAGAEIRDTGVVIGTVDGAAGLIANRLTSDGTLIQLSKDGTTVGSIGSRASAVSYIVLDPRSGSNGGVGLGTTGQALVPCDYAGANVDGTKDLGAASARFKDLYLSGGVHLGGTGSANKLDDYEEGTWSPSLGNSANINSLNLSEAGRYVKAGNLVHLEFDVTGSFVNAAVESRFSFSLPFNTATTSSRATGMFSHLLTSFSNGRFNNGQVFQGITSNSVLFVYVSTNQLSGIGSFNGRASVCYVAS